MWFVFIIDDFVYNDIMEATCITCILHRLGIMIHTKTVYNEHNINDTYYAA